MRISSPGVICKFIICFFLCSFIGTQALADNDVSISVDEGEIRINGKYITKSSTLSDFKKILGEPDRTVNLKNTIHTYDELGVILYQKLGSNAITGITITYGGHRFKFSSNEYFSGKIFIGGDEVNEDYPKESIFLNKALYVSERSASERSRMHLLTDIKAYSGSAAMIFHYAYAGESKNVFVRDNVIDTIYFYWK